MCVSFRGLNRVTKPFQYPIQRCDDAIIFMCTGYGKLWIITLDARQGYHQVPVREEDQEKLAFFAPDGQKYCFTVMPFGPSNAPTFYTAMMSDFKCEWDYLFIIKLRATDKIDGKDVSVSNSNDIHVGDLSIDSGSKTIIDD